MKIMSYVQLVVYLNGIKNVPGKRKIILISYLSTQKKSTSDSFLKTIKKTNNWII